ncbi:MAG: M20/M25/M40 family metallo-hydrolase [Bacteroidetes bacterium]|nr:M20/M25/M40 family metallo-hydrolase [Bacteroidota bacterium]
MYQTTLTLLLTLFISLSLSGQQLSKKEKKIADYIDAHTEEAIQFLEEIVNINSGTMNHEGVRKVGKAFEPEFAELGFEVNWIDLPPEVNRAGHLFAEKKGKKGKKVLLIGHLDTVFEEDSKFQKYEEKENQRADGPGAADMKGGDVVILYALKALKEAGVLDDAQIVVALTGDEEKPGTPISVTRKALIEAGKNADIALGFETGRKGMAVVARRSSTEWKLEVSGTRAHSSGIFSENVGSGAIFETARILNAFHEKVKGEKYLTFNPGVILGGTEVTYDDANSIGTAFGKTNVVSQKVIVEGGIRTISEEQLKNAQEKMREIVENDHLPKTDAKIEFFEGYPPMSPNPANYELLEKYSQISQKLGYEKIEAYDPGARGAADISFVGFIPALGGLGIYGSGAHTPNEDVDLASFSIATKRAALFIYELIQGK